MNNKKIAFVFAMGRKNKVSNPKFAREFFYSFNLFSENYKEVDLIEYRANNNFYLKFIDKILRKISNLPFYLDEAHNRSNFNSLLKSDYIIFTNERIALSSIFIIRKIKKKKKINSLFIVMGLFAKERRNYLVKFIQSKFIRLILKEFNNLVFLSKHELEEAKKRFPDFENKFTYIPFAIDTKFWNKSETASGDKILFIGNDGRRDYKKIIDIAKNLPEFKFVFITSQITKEEKLSSNIELIQGHWNLSKLTDIEIRNYYEEARLTVIPLVDSFQPSGQSVALQSMSMEVPVLISETKGFWDKNDFIQKKDLIFMEDNSLNNWVEVIKELYGNENLLKEISNNAKEKIDNKYRIETFYERLKKVLYL